MTYPLIVTTHLVILLAAYSSPFWLDWRICLILGAIFYLQLMLFKGCVLTMAQFKTKKSELSFHEWLLDQLSIKMNRRRLIFILRWAPVVVLIWAVIWQTALGFAPAVKLP